MAPSYESMTCHQAIQLNAVQTLNIRIEGHAIQNHDSVIEQHGHCFCNIIAEPIILYISMRCVVCWLMRLYQSATFHENPDKSIDSQVKYCDLNKAVAWEIIAKNATHSKNWLNSGMYKCHSSGITVILIIYKLRNHIEVNRYFKSKNLMRIKQNQ